MCWSNCEQSQRAGAQVWAQPDVSGPKLEGSTTHQAAMESEGSSADPGGRLCFLSLLPLFCLWSSSKNKSTMFIYISLKKRRRRKQAMQWWECFKPLNIHDTYLRLPRRHCNRFTAEMNSPSCHIHKESHSDTDGRSAFLTQQKVCLSSCLSTTVIVSSGCMVNSFLVSLAGGKRPLMFVYEWLPVAWQQLGLTPGTVHGVEPSVAVKVKQLKLQKN